MSVNGVTVWCDFVIIDMCMQPCFSYEENIVANRIKLIIENKIGILLSTLRELQLLTWFRLSRG